jgi:hypothetical protein
MLGLEDLLEPRFTESVRIQKILISNAKGVQDRPFDVDQRQNQRIRQTFVFGLNVIDGVTVLYVCVESSDHSVSDGKVGVGGLGINFGSRRNLKSKDR